ncbi:GNAT family N-acetyltransferase [Nocardia neocaledoniensis]|uniref:GNAT family N-acetyltransferase n=1 Tax=Nocardia neocaledoniensis TaxID=236511 RepID=UPI00245897F4|nr:GNAT family N-acetyltransferase [Nocardia neocaledoniensis]
MNISNEQAELRFRSATVDDLAAIAELESHEFKPLAYPYFALRQLFDIHGSQWVVADLGGSICGYALVAVGRRSAWLIGLAVSARFQGQGLGRSLLDRALARCRSSQVEAIFITVRPSNVPAANLYKDSGFTWLDHEEQYFGAGEPRDLLVHRISPEWSAADPADRRWRKDRGPVDDG